MTSNEEKEVWKDLARCSGSPITMFFPEDRNKAGSKAYTAEVQTLREDFCWKCPVRVRCFEYCLEDSNSRLHGVMAGTTQGDRQEFIQVKCRCGGYIDPFDLVHHKSLYCKPCQIERSLDG